MAYGILQGLNEAYDSYRQREREIQQETDMQTEREALARQREREEEAYQYGLSRRPFEEQRAQVQFERDQLGLDRETYEFDEYKADEAERRKALATQREALEQQLKNAQQTYNMNEIKLNAAKGAVKIRRWKNEFMRNMDDKDAVQTLMENFNSDDDDDNNISAVEDRDEGGWTVRYENGEVQQFDSRQDIELYLEQLADPEFHQNYMLQMRINNAKLVASAKTQKESDLKAERLEAQRWRQATLANTDRVFGDRIKEGIVSFGEQGARDVASAVRGIVDSVGAATQYGRVKSAVVDDISRLANTMLTFDPKVLDQRARKVFEELPDTPEFFDPQRFPEGKPDEKDPEYQVALKNLKMADMEKQLQALETEVIRRYARLNPTTGDVTPKADVLSQGEGDDQITDIGLVRPGTEEPMAAELAGAPEDKGLAPRPEPEKPAAPTREEPMALGKFLKTVITNIGNKGSAFDPDGPTVEKGELNQKQRRNIERTAEKAYDDNFDSLNPTQKIGWLRQYGKFLSSSTYREALAKVPASERETLLAAR